MHDARDLSYDDRLRTSLVQGPKEKDRIEAKRTVRGKRTGDVIGFLQATPRGDTFTGDDASTPDGLTKSKSSSLIHSAHSTATVRADGQYGSCCTRPNWWPTTAEGFARYERLIAIGQARLVLDHSLVAFRWV